MVRASLTGDAARATGLRAGFAGHPPAVPAPRRRRRPPRHVWGPEPLAARRLLATFVVTTTDNAGPGSLRQAIVDSNATAGRDEIRFNIAGAGVHTIRP